MNRKVFRTQTGEITAELRTYTPPKSKELRIILNNRYMPRTVRKCDNCDSTQGKPSVKKKWHIFILETKMSSKPFIFCEKCAREQSELSCDAFGYLLHSDLLKSGIDEFSYFPKEGK